MSARDGCQFEGERELFVVDDAEGDVVGDRVGDQLRNLWEECSVGRDEERRRDLRAHDHSTPRLL